MSIKVSQNTEILTVLSVQTLTEDALLTALQVDFPSTGWTALLLIERLEEGRREGRYIKYGGDIYTGVGAGWAANKLMFYLNYPENKVYKGVSAAVPLAPCCPNQNPFTSY